MGCGSSTRVIKVAPKPVGIVRQPSLKALPRKSSLKPIRQDKDKEDKLPPPTLGTLVDIAEGGSSGREASKQAISKLKSPVSRKKSLPLHVRSESAKGPPALVLDGAGGGGGGGGPPAGAPKTPKKVPLHPMRSRPSVSMSQAPVMLEDHPERTDFPAYGSPRYRTPGREARIKQLMLREEWDKPWRKFQEKLKRNEFKRKQARTDETTTQRRRISAAHALAKTLTDPTMDHLHSAPAGLPGAVNCSPKLGATTSHAAVSPSVAGPVPDITIERVEDKLVEGDKDSDRTGAGSNPGPASARAPDTGTRTGKPPQLDVLRVKSLVGLGLRSNSDLSAHGSSSSVTPQSDSPRGSGRSMDPSPLQEHRTLPGSPLPVGHQSPQTERKRVMVLGKLHVRARSNSTSSLYVDSTITAPNDVDNITALARGICSQIKPGDTSLTPFNESLHTSDSKLKSEYRADLQFVNHFIDHLFFSGGIKSDCVIIALIYLERFVKANPCPVTPLNVRPIILCAFLCASKLWDDKGLWNVDCFDMFPDVGSLRQINSWERLFLEALDWNLVVSSSEYAKYFFQLRTSTPMQSLKERRFDSPGLSTHEMEKIVRQYSPPKPRLGAATRSMTEKELMSPRDLMVLS